VESLSSPQQAAALFDVPAVQELFGSVDFIGLSNYPRVTDTSELGQMESAIGALAGEMRALGLDLAALTRGARLVLAEYGFGGGLDGMGTTPARTAADVGLATYYGILGEYKR
jgi:hypothetical protein